MEFGIFDHLDRNAALPLEDFYEQRLRIVAAYDAAGFSCYHVAEHHATPLGMAPSPGIFLAAVAQRTRRLRFGPLVYILPLYHPLRLAEEIVMLDRLSNGRYEVGIGRGISPLESMLYGRDPADSQAVYDEVLAVMRLAFAGDSVSFSGQHFRFENVPVEMHPLQRPHPPFWYGIASAESAARCVAHDLNAVTMMNTPTAREVARHYLEAAAQSGKDGLKIGLVRQIVVAASDAEALAIAHRAHPVWHESFHHLYHAYGRSPVQGERPDFDGMRKLGIAVAGAPETVTEVLADQLAETGANYLVGQFVFGDITLDEGLASIALFAEEVMPALRGQAVAP